VLSEQLALNLGYSNKKARQIRLAAELHDIGKTLIPHEIIHKPYPLNTDEIEIMKMHTVYGAGILSEQYGEQGKLAREIAMLHHEKLHGQGYWGFNASDLPLHINIVAIADVFCALLFKRAYKQPWTVDEALGYISNRAGFDFCPRLTETFLTVVSSCNETKQELNFIRSSTV